MPFYLEEGKPTKLGLFLTPRPREGERTVKLKVRPVHRRSGIFERIVLRDKKRKLYYRDVDLKGIGYVEEERVGKIEPRDEESAWGILDLPSALYARDMTEAFCEKGIRTERYLAIIETNKIIGPDGEKISIKEAKKRGILPWKIEQPVIVLRAFDCKTRIRDLSVPDISPEEVRSLLQDAISIVFKKRVKKEELEEYYEQYLKWFAKTLGRNIGRMHNNGWVHRFLNPHNITLTCAIVDLDGVKSLEELGKSAYEEKELDRRVARESLLELSLILEKLGMRPTIEPASIFWDAYYEEINKYLRKRLKVF